MTGKPFTLEQVLDATREVVEERGYDHVYEPVLREPFMGSILDPIATCVYADNEGNPSCIVGHVVNRLDPETFKILAAVEIAKGGEEARNLIPYGYLPEAFWDREAVQAMEAAQNAQDSGEHWGAALYAAENLGADAE